MKKTTTKRTSTLKTTIQPQDLIVVRYDFNNTTGYYHATSKPEGFDRLPDVLIKEQARSELIRPFASHVIHSPTINGKREFQTMLERIKQQPQIFSGDDYYYKDSKSLILFFFSDSEKVILLHYFRGFYPLTRAARDRFIKSYLA